MQVLRPILCPRLERLSSGHGRVFEHRRRQGHDVRFAARWVVSQPEGVCGGPLFVMTTAGYNMWPALDMARVIDFRVHVDRSAVRGAPGP